MVSKLPSAATVGWEADDQPDIVVDFVSEATDVGMFESACPCCGTIVAFRLLCTATADDTELTDERQ